MEKRKLIQNKLSKEKYLSLLDEVFIPVKRNNGEDNLVETFKRRRETIRTIQKLTGKEKRTILNEAYARFVEKVGYNEQVGETIGK